MIEDDVQGVAKLDQLMSRSQVTWRKRDKSF